MSHKGGKHGRANCKRAREQRRKEGEARDAACAELSPKERLERLDARFGPDAGAKRERARLALWMRNPKARKAAPAAATDSPG